MKRKLFDDFVKEISKEMIEKEYIIKNKTVIECAKFFNISSSMFMRIARYYNMHKPKDLHVAQIKKSKLERYGSENYNNQSKIKETCKQKYGCENVFQRQDIIQDCLNKKLKKYGNKNNIEKNLQTRIQNAGSLTESYKLQFEKYRKTCIKKYGVDNSAKSDVVKEVIIKNYIKNNLKEKQYLTRKQNNTFNTSKPEDEYYQYLLQYFTTDDIVRQYHTDKRYPFACDFYIKSLDLFIELNISWTHGGHLFDSTNPQDIKKLVMWTEKAKISDYYKNAIETWTIRDINKFEQAKKNNLNYKVFYTEQAAYEAKWQ